MPLILAAPLPDFAAHEADERLFWLCDRWARSVAPGLSPAQLVHCRRFGENGEALRARASRLLARLLALRALPVECILDMDEGGRPRVAGAPGWRVAFSHSGRAAFCLVLAPGEEAGRPRAAPALDAEAADARLTTGLGFPAPAPSPRGALRRWVLAEALFKALGGAPRHWDAAARAAHLGATRAAGNWNSAGAQLSWRLLSAPGHALCVALPGGAPFCAGLRWLTWQSFI